MLKRHNATISHASQSVKNPNKRVTVYLRPEFHRALRIKSAETEYSVSDLVNSGVRHALAVDFYGGFLWGDFFMGSDHSNTI